MRLANLICGSVVTLAQIYKSQKKSAGQRGSNPAADFQRNEMTLPKPAKSCKSKNPSDQHKKNALRAIQRLNAHFVLCRGDKSPITTGWQMLRPPIARVLAHFPSGPLGIVPFSIQTTALDKDHGDASQLIAEFPPLAELLSQRPGGMHLYYRDSEGRGNGKWEAHGCSGEVRGARGYVVLWDDPWKLVSALGNPPPDAVPFPQGRARGGITGTAVAG